MNKDKLAGAVLLVIALASGAGYVYLLFFSPDSVSMIVLKLTALGTVGSFLLLMGWIGFSLLVSPPHKKIEEIEQRLAEELRRLREKGYPFPWADLGGSG